MHLPSYLIKILQTIEGHGKEVFLVGGCVRDLIMGLEPADYDVATSASMEEMVSWFPVAAAVGEKWGTVIIQTGGEPVEISTFKGRGEPSPYGPAGLKRDLLLRDFTINAMAMSGDGAIIDPYGGRRDLFDKIIRAPENQARERMAEDPLRLLRAVRFCCTMGFSLHPDVYKALKSSADLLPGVAVERIRMELNRILLSRRPARGMRLLAETGLLEHFLPEVAAMVDFDQRNIRHDKDLFEHTLAVVEAAPPRIKVRLAALLHDIGKIKTFTVDEEGIGHFYGHHLEGPGIAREILKRLKYDNQTVDDVAILVEAHMSRFARLRGASLKKLITAVGEHNLEDLFDLQKADILGSAPPYDFSDLEAMQESIEQILREKPPLRIKDLMINGDDLIALGFQPGPLLGRVLGELLQAVLDDPQKNDREYLLTAAREHL